MSMASRTRRRGRSGRPPPPTRPSLPPPRAGPVPICTSYFYYYYYSRVGAIGGYRGVRGVRAHGRPSIDQAPSLHAPLKPNALGRRGILRINIFLFFWMITCDGWISRLPSSLPRTTALAHAQSRDQQYIIHNTIHNTNNTAAQQPQCARAELSKALPPRPQERRLHEPAGRRGHEGRRRIVRIAILDMDQLRLLVHVEVLLQAKCAIVTPRQSTFAPALARLAPKKIQIPAPSRAKGTLAPFAPWAPAPPQSLTLSSLLTRTRRSRRRPSPGAWVACHTPRAAACPPSAEPRPPPNSSKASGTACAAARRRRTCRERWPRGRHPHRRAVSGRGGGSEVSVDGADVCGAGVRNGGVV
eukprot:scaffold1890_cov105-Isochrysis_galbana.AAC.2